MKQVLTMSPLGRPENTIQGEKYRFTLLTPRLIRLEYSEKGTFEDRPSQSIFNRTFQPVPYRLIQKEEGFELFTDKMQVIYDGKRFTKNGLVIYGQGGLFPHGNIWRYGVDGHNLKGTARTLDETDGACELQDGILSLEGNACIDDSKSLLLTEDGWIEPRTEDVEDLYVFMYGTDYADALYDFYELTGKTPMLPRYALGNWWSRYYTYTEQSYYDLMNRFSEENVPFSVAVIDMDWHLTKIDPKYGSSWTGYTWNKELFPDPERFLGWLHDHGMHTTVNLHPADGIRAYEQRYPEIAKVMGVDYENEEPVNFDMADRKFLNAYFEHILHPMEEEGVDFWWIDWQQGNNTKIPGLDPLWMLNHYHFIDSARDGQRPMTFSRYAGPGSHRYPVGFSGDTVVSWETLDFQPYFTSTASNIGYGWWSHDIGGHMKGYKDNQLALRWLQLGVFSPINRLHSTKNEFNGKEPWRYPQEIHSIMNDFLRLRHQMVPYLYTMNYQAWKDNMPLITPVYYQYPNSFEVYGLKNQYFFGSELMAAPITTKCIDHIARAKTNVWLPDSLWIDFFTGNVYDGGRSVTMYRDLHTMPVLAKAGAIIPMTQEISAVDLNGNPTSLEIRVFGGANGSFTMYEDANSTLGYLDGECVKTAMALDWTGHTFTIAAPKGELSLIPEKRKFTICCFAMVDTAVSVTVDGQTIAVSQSYDAAAGRLLIELPEISSASAVVITFEACEIRKNPVLEQIFDLLNMAELEFDKKTRIFAAVSKEGSAAKKLGAVLACGADEDLYGCIAEILSAYE